MCVGTTIDCDIYNPLDGLDITDVKNLDMESFKKLSYEAQIKNSHWIAQQLVDRVNGSPCLGNYITGRMGLSHEDQFLGFLKPFIQDILNASDLCSVPGGNFVLELENYTNIHTSKGQLYSEIAKGKCELLTGEMCSECTTNPPASGEKLVTVPQPKVNVEAECYYDVIETNYIDRSVDDFLPRKQIDAAYYSGKLKTEEELEALSKQYLVERKFIRKRIEHLQLLELKKELRRKETEKKRSDRNIKTFADYDWEKEIEENNFKNLVVQDLKKYCAKFKLSVVGRKDDLKNRVRGHWFTMKGSCSDNSNSSHEDLVFVDVGELLDDDAGSDINDEVISFELYHSDSSDISDGEFDIRSH